MKRFQLTYHEVKTKLIRAESLEEAQALTYEDIAERNMPNTRMYDDNVYEHADMTPLGSR